MIIYDINREFPESYTHTGRFSPIKFFGQKNGRPDVVACRCFVSLVFAIVASTARRQAEESLRYIRPHGPRTLQRRRSLSHRLHKPAR